VVGVANLLEAAQNHIGYAIGAVLAAALVLGAVVMAAAEAVDRVRHRRRVRRLQPVERPNTVPARIVSGPCAGQTDLLDGHRWWPDVHCARVEGRPGWGWQHHKHVGNGHYRHVGPCTQFRHGFPDLQAPAKTPGSAS
jgi:hypothetical protein